LRLLKSVMRERSKTQYNRTSIMAKPLCFK
jgi:hypothetical protein